MKIAGKLYFFLIALFYSLTICSQQTIQFLSENFNTSSSLYFILNDTVFDSIPDKNQWIINSEYDGQSVYPDVISQDSTYSGTIASAPYSSYLHIHDTSALPVANANFDRSVASDAFVGMKNGLCTYGMSDIVFTFFYTGQGNPDAYAELYYSANGGAWTQVGTKYYGKRKWKYETVTDPIFDNKEDLRFGFRWVNLATTGSDSTSFGVDDIMIVGTFDNVNNPNDISITYVDSAVCQGKPLTFTFGLQDTLCDGTYEIEVSNLNGSFNSPIGTWVTNMSYPLLSKSVSIIIPGNAPKGNCYYVRVNRIWPLPSITGLTSVCFIIDSCSNEIQTEQPAVTLDTMAVCINSAIDVPFWSFGIFLSGNQYVAELSDSNGSFASPSIINSIPDEKTYDPALVPSPGQVAGLVPSVDPGCGYYVRVNSTNPAVNGTPWGPFCIRECDVELNQKQDISVCISDTAGDTINVPVDINIWNAVANYSSGNVFSVEVLDPKTFGQVNFAGLGVKASTTSTSLDIDIPPTPGLAGLGMKDGLWYIRLIASNSTNSMDVWSNVIRLTIG
ncbi:MAG TPA: hypothetical protein EYQ86_07175, partial [Bacteroidetes bacterium]|nr:hypothetical protein [Bacteroidota bacterium]